MPPVPEVFRGNGSRGVGSREDLAGGGTPGILADARGGGSWEHWRRTPFVGARRVPDAGGFGLLEVGGHVPGGKAAIRRPF